MQLDQHSIVIVMMVVFSSTLLISAGLVFALIRTDAGRLWAGGHLVLSAGGLALTLNAATAHLVEVGAVAAMVYLAGKLTIYGGVRVHQGLPGFTRIQGAAVVIAVAASLDALTGPQPVLQLHRVAYVALALLSLATILVLLRSRVRHSEIGLPLVLLASAVQLCAQLYGAAVAWQGDGAISPSPFNAGSLAHDATYNAVVVLAPLVATLLGLFGFTVMALEQVIANKERGARIDGLTGLLNRAALDNAASRLIVSALRNRQAVACLVIDVDHFKQVNDRSGHRAGDAVLQAIAEALDNSCRASDVAGRYGGEEFCVLCPHTDEHQATALARRILRKVRAIPLPGPAGKFASVSIGVAQLRDDGSDSVGLWQQLFGNADRALYEAKRRGRDRYVVASTLEREEAMAAAASASAVASRPAAEAGPASAAAASEIPLEADVSGDGR
ncbi:GGDEF domain-containing protein [Cupriavidus gilardii]|uniref:GGDEF domain-containing protein n=1 Tax=Cupriavidus gilardii TaxID=82541 RepID=UPI0021C077DE|nr:GGDEF domain-containing protein [Cupriavidus gilardii]MCT9054030.1 GGDEF domain-containing protein [Cupriavidus gilardii]WNG68542.1 GGDEF domain-containing protein [Cupriavidus gilardii]